MRLTWVATLGPLILFGCADGGPAVEGAAANGELAGTEDAADSTQRIIDGVPVDGAGPREQWEGIVQIFTSKGACTGAFITASHVLSAGHCFASEGIQSLWLRAPTWDDGRLHEFRDSWVGIRGIARANDLALVTLSAPSSWATPARRFRLLTGGTPRGARLNIYGYGAYDQANNNDGRLRTPPSGATIQIDQEGRGYFEADVHEARICWGDSGGPALDEGGFAVIWGVAHSFSRKEGTDRPCPTRNHEMTWTNVNANLPFIERQLGFACSRFVRGDQKYARCW